MKLINLPRILLVSLSCTDTIFLKLDYPFWRDIDLTEETLQEDCWFKEMSPENQEDTAKHLYFGAVGVFNPKQ